MFFAGHFRRRYGQSGAGVSRHPVATQQGWQSDEVALERWRQALQGVGIHVFKDAFRAEGYSGFCLYDEAFPVIYVNNTSSKTRQIFTLFHELAHLLFHTSGVDSLTDEYIPELPRDAQQIEVLCNQFAAVFLVPDEEFEAAFVGREPSEETAHELAALFHVSREVVLRKFLALRQLVCKRIANATFAQLFS